MRTRRTRVALATALACVALAIAAFFLARRREAPRSPTDLVPTSWSTARTTPMHEVHVGKGKVACASCHTKGFGESPGTAVCATCHAGQAARAHVGSAARPTTCLTCHAFSASTVPAPCTTCHAVDSERDPRHPPRARGLDEAPRGACERPSPLRDVPHASRRAGGAREKRCIVHGVPRRDGHPWGTSRSHARGASRRRTGGRTDGRGSPWDSGRVGHVRHLPRASPEGTHRGSDMRRMSRESGIEAARRVHDLP